MFDFELQYNESIVDKASSKTSLDYQKGDKVEEDIPDENNENVYFYEFEIKRVDSIPGYNEKNLSFINIKDITQLIKSQ